MPKMDFFYNKQETNNSFLLVTNLNIQIKRILHNSVIMRELSTGI